MAKKRLPRPSYTHIAKPCGCWTRVYANGGVEQLCCREHSVLAPTAWVRYGSLRSCLGKR